ncbi:hypothetical protein Dxin01_00621 [Deinococcus xinjiangensis]|uniref:Uncharacterized protein n=1 Tax=Deinococcus xinjiangensis TaxID=457454 RepID=A0ABP9V6J1_9DEIO
MPRQSSLEVSAECAFIPAAVAAEILSVDPPRNGNPERHQDTQEPILVRGHSGEGQ